MILCDIRDWAAVHTIFAERRPEVVFHAAALKHLPMLEQYPAEAVKTNVIGTQTVLDAAELVDVRTFVNISTDKAANPCSVLGYSKRIAESLTANHALALRAGLRLGPVRQRPGQQGLRPLDVRPAARRRWSAHGHRPGRHPLLHDHRGGLSAGHPGGGHRPTR